MPKLTDKELAYQREYHSRPENKEKARLRNRERYKLPEVKAKKKAYQERPEVKERIQKWSRAYNKSRHLTKEYGITTEDFLALLNNQGGVCACCGTRNWDGHGPCVDHDHGSGNICGIVCNHCNVAAGQLGDSPEKARLLLSYLEKTRGS